MKIRFTSVVILCVWWMSTVCCEDHGLFENRANRDANNDYEWFDQKLDHFNPNDRRTWKQRYEIYSNYYYEGGPVFLNLETDSSPPLYKKKDYSQWMEEAKEFDAMCFSLKHRYYGNNYTMAITSAESYEYLTVEQALADVKEFVTYIRSKYCLKSNKIIVHGSLYPGYLAILSRMHYPDHIHAAYASSPIVDYQWDENEKNEKIKKALAYADRQCAQQVQDGFDELYRHFRTKPGRKIIKNKFNLCTLPTAFTETDRVQLLATLRKSFKYALQNDGTDTSFDIRHVCGIMVDESLGEPRKRLREITEQFLKHYDLGCLKNDYQYNTTSNKAYIEEVDRALSSRHSDCFKQMKLAEQELELFLNSSYGSYRLQYMFKLCGSPDKFSERSKELLFNNLIGVFAHAVQFDITETMNVEYVCKVMTDQSVRNPMDKLGKLYQARKEGCVNYDFNEEIKNIKSMSSSADISWRYQCCSELGNIRVSNNNNSLFGNNLPLDFSEHMCTALFGDQFTHKRLKKRRQEVNELKIKLPNHRILATQGSLDLFYRELLPNKYKEYFDTHVLIGISQTVDEFIEDFKSTDSEVKSAKKQRRLFLEHCGVGDDTSTGRTMLRSVRNFFSRIFR